MGKRLLSWLSSLLIVIGILLPAVQALADQPTGGWTITSSGPTYDVAANTTKWKYTLKPTDPPSQDISHVVLALCQGLTIKSASPGYASIGLDPTTQVDGVKFETQSLKQGGTIEVTYNGLWETGSQSGAVKAGQDIWHQSVSGPSCTPFTPTIDFAVTKKVSATNDAAAAGAEITFNGEQGTAHYFYTVTNASIVPLTLSANDDQLGTIAFSPNPVPAGGTATAYASKPFAKLNFDGTAYDHTNTVTVTGTYGTASLTKEDTAVVHVLPAAAVSNFTLTKGVSKDPADANPGSSITFDGVGGTAHYFYTLTNTGDIPLTISYADDDQIDDNISFSSTTVPVGGTVTATASKSFAVLAPGQANDTETNTITVTANDVTKTDTASVTRKAATLGLTALCWIDADTWGWQVSNPTPYSVDFTYQSDGDATVFNGTVGPNGTTALTTPRSSGTLMTLYVNNIRQDGAEHNATQCGLPSITVTKQVSTNPESFNSDSIMLGAAGTAYFYYTVTNTSQLTLRITSAVDDQLGPISLDKATLEPGEQAVGTASADFPALLPGTPPETITNIFTVTAVNVEDESQSVSGKASAHVTLTAPPAVVNFTLTKHVSGTESNGGSSYLELPGGGGTAWYFYTLTNEGNVPITITSSYDDQLDTALPFSKTTIEPGETIVAKLSATWQPLGADDDSEVITNIATVTAGGETRSAEATVFRDPPEPHPGIEIVKHVNTGVSDAGQTSLTLQGGGPVTYFYTVTNTGDVTLLIESVEDDILGVLAGPTDDNWYAFELAPGANWSTTATKTFPALAAGSQSQSETNTVVVEAFYPRRERRLTDFATATVVNRPRQLPPPPPAASPSFEVDKLVSTVNNPATGSHGLTINGAATVYYFYTITNTGDVSLDLLDAVDDKIGALAFTPTSIPPGGKATATASKTLAAGQSETNVVTVRTQYGSRIVGPKSATVSVLNTSQPLGSVEVRVVDGSARNQGQQRPIRDALVTFSNGQSGRTDNQGRILFTGLPFGTYSATGESTDPLNPVATSLQQGTGSTSIDAANPDDAITIILAWADSPNVDAAAAGVQVLTCPALGMQGVVIVAAGPDGITRTITAPDASGRFHLSDLTQGDWTITMTAPGLSEPVSRTITMGAEDVVLDFSAICPPSAGIAEAGLGSIEGRICAPAEPGAEITATSLDGKTVVTTSVAANGVLGQWRNFALSGLVPGTYTLSLKLSGQAAVTQTVVVTADSTTMAPDFSLACTGEPASPLYTYMFGPALAGAGLLLRLWPARRRRFGRA